MKTVLITGCSSGFGLETAKYFLERDWNVIATMRNVREDILPRSDRLRVLALDVTDGESIAKAMDAAGDIDVLVNNAGIGWFNALEGTPVELTRRIFKTNTVGLIAMTQAVLPQFRKRKAGVIINVTSSVTMKPLHLLSVYTASKAAVNAFSDVLALELEPFNIRVKVVLPGRAPETKFGENAKALAADGGSIPDAYGKMVKQVFADRAQQPQDDVTLSGDVAEAVWRAATDIECPAHLPAGIDAIKLAELNGS